MTRSSSCPPPSSAASRPFGAKELEVLKKCKRSIGNKREELRIDDATLFSREA